MSVAADAPRASVARQLAWGFAGWMLFGVASVQTTATRLQLAGLPVPWRELLAGTFAGMVTWALYTPLILRASEAWPLDGRAWRRDRVALAANVARHLALAVALVALDAVLLAPFSRELPALEARPLHAFVARVLGMLMVDLISYAAIVGIGTAAAFRRRLREEQARSAELSAQLVTSQLSALRAQLQPHFFFNTLNAIAELVHRDPESADRMITRLGAFLRRSLATSERVEVPLDEELEALEAYLDVVRLRFGDRLTVRLDVDLALLAVPVPPLLLQPLVENAVQHGLERREGAGLLAIVVRGAGDRLRLEVHDDGAGLAAAPDLDAPAAGDGHGIGLRNTRDRLRRLYGGRAALGLAPREPRGCTAWVELPLPGPAAYVTGEFDAIGAMRVMRGAA